MGTVRAKLDIPSKVAGDDEPASSAKKETTETVNEALSKLHKELSRPQAENTSSSSLSHRLSSQPGHQFSQEELATRQTVKVQSIHRTIKAVIPIIKRGQ